MQFSDLFHRSGLIAAHRGDRAVAPENTLAAFRKSIGRCDFIELDVQYSRDGVPVVIHDETLERTSNVGDIEACRRRFPWRVCDFTLEELKSFDYGSWFDRDDPFGRRHGGDRDVEEEGYAGAVILTLEELLHFASVNDILLNVEMKDVHATMADERAVAGVLDVIEALGCTDRILLSSFYHPYLIRAKRSVPGLATAALQEGSHPEALVAYLHRLGVAGYHCDDAIVTEEIVTQLKAAGFFVGVYTVNDSKRQEELFRWGVNAVFTDMPDLPLQQAPGR